MVEPDDLRLTRDWSGSREHWPELFAHHGLTGKLAARFLEIGCYEGQTTRWLLDNVLTGVGASIVVCDPFKEDIEQYERFRANTGYPDRPGIEIVMGKSQNRLPELIAHGAQFDFTYVDGSHEPEDVLDDAIHAFRLTLPGGLILFDDYDWPDAPGTQNVKLAVDSFCDCYHALLAGAHPSGRDQFLVVKR